MSQDSGKTSKKQRRGDANLNALRTARNKVRRVAKNARRAARDAELRGMRKKLRASGALKRWEKRYADLLKAANEIEADIDRKIVLDNINGTNAKIRFAAGLAA